ncbi:MAG: KEOPS complex kinase/ATPase Bud32 [archaeon]
MVKIIGRGAEAILSQSGKHLLKQRVAKGYRLPVLDERLRKSRTKKESKLLEKAFKLIPTPKLIKSSDKDKEITMEFIKGKKLSETLDDLKNSKSVCQQIGKNIAKLHDADIIHGDLTTSNMILKSGKVYFIDYGLGYESNKIEDKAVDLHLIKQALEAKHFKHFETFFAAVLQGYKESKHSKETLKRLEAVEKRGRYKQAY